jgi:[histone H3]-lysine36 N-trimethyltransferase
MPPGDDVNTKQDSSRVIPDGLSNGRPVIVKTESEAEVGALGSPAYIMETADRSKSASTPARASSSSLSPASKASESSSSPLMKLENESEGKASDMMTSSIGGDITFKQEPGKPPKLARSSSQKVVARPPQLFNHLPDSVNEACQTFEVIQGCIYGSKYMGHTEHAMECDCSEEWGKLPLTFSSFLRYLEAIR